jgi:hypothetical protein
VCGRGNACFSNNNKSVDFRVKILLTTQKERFYNAVFKLRLKNNPSSDALLSVCTPAASSGNSSLLFPTFLNP